MHPQGIFSKGTVMQELLHNFGMYHGYGGDVEYEDRSTAMGKGNSCCPSAPELWRLGWAMPMAQLNSSTFPMATYKNFKLPATYLGPEGAMIKIQPDWLGINNYTKLIFTNSTESSTTVLPLRGIQSLISSRHSLPTDQSILLTYYSINCICSLEHTTTRPRPSW
ncbi:hypothetical protein Vafri_5644 [Volvox africanus]|uniref:Peptidase M11 gametolysin domain-containing protein n=1 Tax=Volvox africanus TaxID=51714 RepID=A0A8J4EX59_9CHLO|nr:hypothetical protein Vafri_5644 [Volvox africanus]